MQIGAQVTCDCSPHGIQADVAAHHQRNCTTLCPWHEVVSNHSRAMPFLAAAKINPETNRINEMPLHLQVRCQAKRRAGPAYKNCIYLFPQVENRDLTEKQTQPWSVLKGKNPQTHMPDVFRSWMGFVYGFVAFSMNSALL